MAMLIDDMDISHLMIFAQQIEESKLEEKSRDKRGLNLMMMKPMDMVYLGLYKITLGNIPQVLLS